MNINLNQSDIYIITGEADIKVDSGRISVIAKEMREGESLTVPKGKKIPIEALEESMVTVDTGPCGSSEKLRAKTIPESWDELAEEFMKKKPGIILILGEVDTGKTFFTTYIANKLKTGNLEVGIIDCDMGQSDIGPPGTIGLVVLEEPIVFLSGKEPDELYFTGAHSPGLHLLSSLVGVKKLSEIACHRCDTVLIDTPGWVQGDGGRLLRRSEIEILMPDTIILMQREDELEHLVRNYPQDKVARIKVSKKASSTSPEERKGLRELLSMRYFKGSTEHVLSFKDFETDRVYFKTGKPAELPVENLWSERLSGWEGVLVVTDRMFDESDIEKIKQELKVFKIHNIVAGQERGMLAGLLDETGRVLGLGIIKEIDWQGQKLTVRTPLRLEDISGVNIIQFGSLKLTPDGREAGFVSPGYF